jgi:hypothetical protein
LALLDFFIEASPIERLRILSRQHDSGMSVPSPLHSLTDSTAQALKAAGKDPDQLASLLKALAEKPARLDAVMKAVGGVEDKAAALDEPPTRSGLLTQDQLRQLAGARSPAELQDAWAEVMAEIEDSGAAGTGINRRRPAESAERPKPRNARPRAQRSDQPEKQAAPSGDE